MKKCRHCHARKANRPRLLCWSCYYTPGVRELYGAKPYRNRWGAVVVMDTEDEYKGAGKRLPKKPTAALPGSPEKCAILRARAARGEELWHPLDALNGGQHESV